MDEQDNTSHAVPAAEDGTSSSSLNPAARTTENDNGSGDVQKTMLEMSPFPGETDAADEGGGQMVVEDAPSDPPVSMENSFDPQALVLTGYQCVNCDQMVVALPEFPLRGCMFCSASYEDVEPTDTLLWAPDSIVPFNVDKGLFFEMALRWLANGELTPDDIFRQVYLDLVEELYLPFYLYEGTYTAEFSASVGTERLNPETKETAIDWQRTSGTLDGDLALLQYAAIGGLPDDIIRFMEGMPIDERAIRPFSEYTIEGSVFRPFDVDAEVLYEYKTASDLQHLIEKQVREQLNNTHVQDLVATPNITYTMRSVYLPFWLLNYQYKNQSYYTVVDGFMSSKRKSPRIFGTKPKDEYRELLLQTLFFPFKVSVAVGALITLLLLFFTMDWSGWWRFVIILSFIVYVLATLKRTERRRFNLLKTSKENKNLALRHLQQNALDILTHSWRADLFAQMDAQHAQEDALDTKITAS